MSPTYIQGKCFRILSALILTIVFKGGRFSSTEEVQREIMVGPIHLSLLNKGFTSLATNMSLQTSLCPGNHPQRGKKQNTTNISNLLSLISSQQPPSNSTDNSFSESNIFY